jgi:hypothetical protein
MADDDQPLALTIEATEQEATEQTDDADAPETDTADTKPADTDTADTDTPAQEETSTATSTAAVPALAPEPPVAPAPAATPAPAAAKTTVTTTVKKSATTPAAPAAAAKKPVLLPGTGSLVKGIGDDFEDENWKWNYNHPKSSEEQDKRVRSPLGRSVNGRRPSAGRTERPWGGAQCHAREARSKGAAAAGLRGPCGASPSGR